MYQPGPELIYECPNCGWIFERSSIGSGNTFGALPFSDGKLIAPMLPDYGMFTKCGNCNAILDISVLTEIGIHDWYVTHKSKWYIDPSSKKWTHTESLGMQDFYKALALFPQHELYIRQRILWLYNDNIRDNILKGYDIKDMLPYSETEKDTYEDNCRALIKLLEHQTGILEFLKSNLEDMDKYVEWLNSLDDGGDAYLKEQTESLKRSIEWSYSMEKDKNDCRKNIKERLDDESSSQRQLIAELYRNLGNFDKCMEWINNIHSKRPHYVKLKQLFEAKCKEGNKLLFTYKYD